MSDLATVDQARDRADRIRASAVAVADWLSDIRGAYASRDWESLGYATWHDYLEGEFGEHRISLPVEERREVVAVMSRAGMSMRAIAPVLGVSHETVRKDIAPTVKNLTDGEQPARVQSLDGRSRPATQPRPDPTSEPREYDGPQPRPIDEDRLIDALDRRKPGVRADIERTQLRARWSKALAGAADVTLLSPDLIAGAVDPSVLGLGVSTLRRALRVAESAESRLQPGLRIIGGGQ